MSKLLFLIFTFVLCNNLAAADQPDKPGAHKKVICTDDQHTFNLYLPTTYETKPKKRFPVLYISSPGGNPSFLKLEQWAEAREFILIGINGSKNGPENIVFGAQDEVLKSTAYLRKHHCLQFATGFSGAASASVKLAKRYPQMIAGVLLHAHSGNGAFCLPGQSVTFLYGAKDKIQSPNYVEKAIEKYERNRFHLAAKKLDAGHKWGGLEDTQAMLDFMFNFQRFNNPNLTKQDIVSAIETELTFFNAIDDPISREDKLFHHYQSISDIPGVAKAKIGKKVLATWGESHIEILEEHQGSPVEAFALSNYATRSALIKLLKGSLKSTHKKLMDPILKDQEVAKEMKALSHFQRLAKKEARLNGNPNQTKSLLKQYKNLIDHNPGTLASKQAELRINALKSH